MDPQLGPVTLTISGTAAQHLQRLMDASGSTDGGAVMMRALGLLDIALKAKRDGKTIGIYDSQSETLQTVAF